MLFRSSSQISSSRCGRRKELSSVNSSKQRIAVYPFTMREVPPKHPSPPLSSPASTSKAVPRLLATSTSVLLRARSASPSSSPRGVRSRTCDSSRPGQAIAEAQTTRTHSLLSIVHFLTPTTSRILSPTSRSQCRQRRPVGARPRQRRATDAALRRFVLGASSIRTADRKSVV